MTRQRLLVVVTTTLAVGLAVWFAVGAWIASSACCWLSPAWLGQALALAAGLNATALLVFLIGRARLHRAAALLAGVEAGNVLFALAAAVAVSSAWLLEAGVAGLTTVLLVLVIRTQRGEPS